MGDMRKVLTHVGKGVSRVAVGPAGDTLPAAFQSVVELGEFRTTLDLEFDGDRVSAKSLQVVRINGGNLTPRDLANVRLGEVIHEAAKAAVQPGHGAHIDPREDRKPNEEELRLIAACYWFHHVTWGNPRRAVMAIWRTKGNELPRATANRWIRKALELHGIPKGAEDER